MTNDGGRGRPRTEEEGRRNDFTKALLAVGVTAALVIALVGPASRDVRPSTLLEDAVAVNVVARSVDDAPRPITSSARRDRSGAISGNALVLEIVAPLATESTSECVPCLTGDRPHSRPRHTPASVTADAAKATDRPDPGKAAVAQAPAPTANDQAAPDAAPAKPEKRRSPNASPAAPPASDPVPAVRGSSAEGRGQSADHANSPATPTADDRPGNDASSSDDKQKAKR